jgi:hypothetical protein
VRGLWLTDRDLPRGNRRLPGSEGLLAGKVSIIGLFSPAQPLLGREYTLCRYQSSYG